MKKNRIRPVKDPPLYRQLWFVVDGAVMDALRHHPEYLATEYRTRFGERTVRNSINKRVTGALTSYAMRRVSSGKPKD